MKLPPWRVVSRSLGVRPVLSVDAGPRPSVRVERYLFQTTRQTLPALDTSLLVVHLGGARVSGGRVHGRRSNYLPSFAVFLAAGSASEWFLEGAVDVAGLYLPPPIGERLARLLPPSPGQVPAEFPFADLLVTAAATQLVEELRRGDDADAAFVARLLTLLLHQTERVLRGRAGNRLEPSRTQLSRLKSVLAWIDRNPGTTITNAVLARQAGVSESYFRHAFVQSLGVSPGQYVRQRRLERARELLTATSLPIAHIAAECGFASQSYLTTCFRARHGVTPARYRRALAGASSGGPGRRAAAR